MTNQTVRLDDELMEALRIEMAKQGGLKFQGLMLKLITGWLSGESSQKSAEYASEPSRESDMISIAELNEADTQLVVNLIAMLRDDKSPVLPFLREGLKRYTPEARDEDIGRKDRRHRRKKA